MCRCRILSMTVLAFLASACLQQPAPPLEPTPAVLQPAPPECAERVTHSEEGLASWYGRGFEGRRTASGETFRKGEATAAHRTLPMGTQVKVTNLETGEVASLTINDRGPQRRGRILDVSEQAARDLGFKNDGTTRVRVEAVEAC
jgi:rare lipoprotein A